MLVLTEYFGGRAGLLVLTQYFVGRAGLLVFAQYFGGRAGSLSSYFNFLGFLLSPIFLLFHNTSIFLVYFGG